MGNKATSIKDQIELLKSRGMKLDLGEEKVKEVLLDIGYYRLGFYWHPFEKDKEHNFKEGTKFSDVLELYYFDVDLRRLLIRCINRIEINFRTKVVYYGSNTYKDSSTWFADPAVMTADYIASFKLHYDAEFIRKNKTIKNHHDKHINDKHAPAWKTLEFLTFGAVLKILACTKENYVKQKVSDAYGIKNIGKFINLIGTIVYVRNVCAHGGVLFDLVTPKGIAILPSIVFNNQNRNSLDASIKIILFFLEIISKNRHSELKSNIDELFQKIENNETLKTLIVYKTGYKYDLGI